MKALWVLLGTVISLNCAFAEPPGYPERIEATFSGEQNAPLRAWLTESFGKLPELDRAFYWRYFERASELIRSGNTDSGIELLSRAKAQVLAELGRIERSRSAAAATCEALLSPPVPELGEPKTALSPSDLQDLATKSLKELAFVEPPKPVAPPPTPIQSAPPQPQVQNQAPLQVSIEVTVHNHLPLLNSIEAWVRNPASDPAPRFQYPGYNPLEMEFVNGIQRQGWRSDLEARMIFALTHMSYGFRKQYVAFLGTLCGSLDATVAKNGQDFATSQVLGILDAMEANYQ